MKYKLITIALFAIVTLGFVVGYVTYNRKINMMIEQEIIQVSIDELVLSHSEEPMNSDSPDEVEADTEALIVPDLFQLTENEANENLEKLGFNPVIKKEHNNEFEEGIVFWQNPLAGEFSFQSAEIQYTVSLGESMGIEEEKIIVPNVIGLLKNDAEAILHEKGFNVAYEYNPSENYDKNYVYSQNYKVDASVSKGTEVTIRISTGQ